MVAMIQISYILSRCAAAENTVLMTSGFVLSQSALYFCCSTPGQDITNTCSIVYTPVNMWIILVCTVLTYKRKGGKGNRERREWERGGGGSKWEENGKGEGGE